MPKGERDRFGIAREGCAKCAAHASGSRGGGVVILFYAYVRVSDPSALAARLRAACASAGVTGKIRVAAEGINGTAAGPAVGVESLIGHITNDTHEPELASASRSMDWKRQRGCAHLFADVSVRVVPEIVPFDDPARTIDPNASGALKLERLDPVAFHAEAARAASAFRAERGASSERSSTVLLDVRNWYESRLGYFAGAVRAPIRRFSQLKEWLDMDPFRFKDKRVLAYCTGGVRCEKACAFLASLDENRRPRSVAQLRGGVAAYARDVAGCAEAIETVKRTSGEDTETIAVPREATEMRDRRDGENGEKKKRRIRKKKKQIPVSRLELRVRRARRDQSHRRRVRSVRRVRATHGSRGRVQKRGVPHASARLRIVRGARDAYAAYAARRRFRRNGCDDEASDG